MPEASIVITAQDRSSDSIRKMAQQTRACDKDAEGLGERCLFRGWDLGAGGGSDTE